MAGLFDVAKELARLSKQRLKLIKVGSPSVVAGPSLPVAHSYTLGRHG